jgi:hypothetical protein
MCCRLNETTKLKAKIDTTATVTASFRHKLSPPFTLTLCAEVYAVYYFMCSGEGLVDKRRVYADQRAGLLSGQSQVWAWLEV